jgi:hypothetical protein
MDEAQAVGRHPRGRPGTQAERAAVILDVEELRPTKAAVVAL